MPEHGDVFWQEVLQMMYNMADFEELADLSGRCRKWYPKFPEEAVDYFIDEYGLSHLISTLVVVNVWAYLQAENILLTGDLLEPISNSREWTTRDFTNVAKALRN